MAEATTEELIPLNIEPTQEYFLQAMRDLGFTEDQIEANRKHNGRLFLTPAVVIGLIRGTLGGEKILAISGALVSEEVER